MPALPYWFWPGDDRPTEEIDDEIAEELRLHLDLLAEHNMRESQTPDEAKRNAAERFGDFDTVLRRCRTEKQGDIPMLKRIQAVLTLLLLIGVVFLGVRDYVTAGTTAQHMDQTTGFLKSIQGDLAKLREGMALNSTPVAATEVAETGPYLEPGTIIEAGTVIDVVDSAKAIERYEIAKRSMARADLNGNVFDTNGKPIVEADVLLIIKTWPNNRFRQDDYAVKTDASGSFVLNGRIPLDGQYGVNAVVVGEDQAIASQYVLVKDPQGQPPEELDFKLSPSVKTRVVITDENGEPVAKALVAPSGRIAADDSEHIVYHQGSNPVWKKTDAEGAVMIDWFATGDLGKINIRPRGGEWQEKKIDMDEVSDGTITIAVED